MLLCVDVGLDGLTVELTPIFGDFCHERMMFNLLHVLFCDQLFILQFVEGYSRLEQTDQLMFQGL